MCWHSPGAIKNRPIFAAPRGLPGEFLLSCAQMASVGPYEIHVEARGPHWVSWLTRGTDTKPDRSVLLVAASEEDARARAEAWARQEIATAGAPVETTPPTK